MWLASLAKESSSKESYVFNSGKRGSLRSRKNLILKARELYSVNKRGSLRSRKNLLLTKLMFSIPVKVARFARERI